MEAIGEKGFHTAVRGAERDKVQSVPQISVSHWPKRHQLVSAHDPAHLLLVEDHDQTWSFLASSLRSAGFDVSECVGAKELLDLLDLQGPAAFLEHFDLVIADANMSILSGLDILAWEQQSCSGPPVILIMHRDDHCARQEAIRLGAAATFDKPIAIHELLDKVHKVLF